VVFEAKARSFQGHVYDFLSLKSWTVVEDFIPVFLEYISCSWPGSSLCLQVSAVCSVVHCG